MTKHDKGRGVAIMEFIERWQLAQGYPPTVREIARAVGLASTSAVHHHLTLLRDAGLVVWEPRQNRSLRLVQFVPDSTIADALRLVRERAEVGEFDLPGMRLPGLCRNPACRKALEDGAVGREYHSKSCQSIANHVKRWMRAAIRESAAVA